uniref:Lipoprotein n=1 Tax=uncultured Desulfobacterium sp. TaxID=201089 RepID=E1YIA4_9BACT|nr:unknown protein [uncultured Desulfobacterium sp.]
MNKSNVVNSVYVFLILLVIVMITGCAPTSSETQPQPTAHFTGTSRDGQMVGQLTAISRYGQGPVSGEVLLPDSSENRQSSQQARANMRTPDQAECTADQIVAAAAVMEPLRQSILTKLTKMESGSWVLIHRGALPVVNFVPAPQSGLLVRRVPGDGSEARYEAWNWRKGEPCPAQLVLLSE